MNLLRYIKGLRRGKEAHRVELEAMKDVFLSEALEGYDAIDGNHLKQITYLQKQVKKHKRKKNKFVTVKPVLKQIPIRPKMNFPWKNGSIAAIFLLCLVLGTYFIVTNYESLFEYQPITVSPYKNTEDSLEYEKDTVKFHQDTLIIYMPKPPPLPKKNLITSEQILQDSLKKNRMGIEIFKLDTPQTQLEVTVTTEPENSTENESKIQE